MRPIRTAAAATAAMLLLTPVAACTPDPTVDPLPPPPPSPSSTVTLPAGWPDTVQPDQVETYQKAIAAFTQAGDVIANTYDDPKATKFPDEISKYADPDGAWVKSELDLLVRYRAAGWRIVGSATWVVVPLARTTWNGNQVGIYVCGDGRQTVTYDANGKNLGKGRIIHAKLTVQNGAAGWRVTGFEPGTSDEFTETKQCGQDEN